MKEVYACLSRIGLLEEDVEGVQADMQALDFAIRQNIEVDVQVFSQKKDIEILKLENEKLHARVDELGVLLYKVMGQMSEMVAKSVSPPSSPSFAQKPSPEGGASAPPGGCIEGGLRIPQST